MPPVRGLPRLSPLELEETKVWVADMLKKGLISPSMGPYVSIFFFVTKPNGGLRGVCDFRGVNLITKKILPTLPLFENVVSQLEGANFFSGLDLTSMSYQLRIREEDIEKTVFRTAIGNYAYVVTPMGSTGSVGSTVLMMQSALSHVISLPGETLPSKKIKNDGESEPKIFRRHVPSDFLRAARNQRPCTRGTWWWSNNCGGRITNLVSYRGAIPHPGPTGDCSSATCIASLSTCDQCMECFLPNDCWAACFSGNNQHL
jgi:hypothetical protein